MPDSLHTEKSSLTTVIAITAVSSCIMLAAVGTYRLASEGSQKQARDVAENAITESDEAP